MSQENLEVVRRVYEGLNSGARADSLSDEVLATVFDPGIEVRQLSDLPGTAGTFHGYDGLREADREVHEALRDNRWEPVEQVATGEFVAVAVRVTATGRASGARTEWRVGHLFQLRDRRVVRWVVYGRPEEAFETAGLRA